MPTVNIARQRSLYSDSIERHTPALQRDISRLREQLTTGRRVNRPSDDPDAFAVAEQMKRLGGELERHEASIEAARPWVDQTQETLNRMADLFARAQEEGVQAANNTLSSADRDAIAESLRSLRDEVVDQLNATHNGEYLFAGTRTNDAPFDAGSTPPGQPTTSYADIDDPRTRPIGPNQDLAVNITGAELHQMGGGETITGALNDLIDRVENDDLTGIQTQLDTIEKARDHVVDKGAKAGTIGRRLTTAKEQLETTRLTVEERRSEAEDTDFLETVSSLQQTQTQLQAALRATASTLQTSLVDFL
jgi:flagellar hook-associated protein 3 FlgL